MDDGLAARSTNYLGGLERVAYRQHDPQHRDDDDDSTTMPGHRGVDSMAIPVLGPRSQMRIISPQRLAIHRPESHHRQVTTVVTQTM